jgi:hypothetical protein
LVGELTTEWLEPIGKIHWTLSFFLLLLSGYFFFSRLLVSKNDRTYVLYIVLLYSNFFLSFIILLSPFFHFHFHFQLAARVFGCSWFHSFVLNSFLLHSLGCCVVWGKRRWKKIRLAMMGVLAHHYKIDAGRNLYLKTESLAMILLSLRNNYITHRWKRQNSLKKFIIIDYLTMWWRFYKFHKNFQTFFFISPYRRLVSDTISNLVFLSIALKRFQADAWKWHFNF